MKFLILFIVLMIKRYRTLPERSPISQSYLKWLKFWSEFQWIKTVPRHLKYLLLVLLPTFIVTSVFWLSESWLWGLITVIAEIALLLYVFSHSGVERRYNEYVEGVQRGDVLAAQQCAQSYLALPEAEINDQQQDLNEQVIKALLHRWFEYFFLMVFWYMIADVAGVLLAWFTVQYARANELDTKAWHYLHWLEWVPVRLLGLTFGLAGNLMNALPVWQSYLWRTRANNANLLFDVAEASLREGKEPRHWHSALEEPEQAVNDLEEWQLLHWRCASIWMVVIAAAAIGGVLV